MYKSERNVLLLTVLSVFVLSAVDLIFDIIDELWNQSTGITVELLKHTYC